MVIFGIAAGWFSSAGLALDIVGFGLLASDIYSALHSESMANVERWLTRSGIESARGSGGGQPISPPMGLQTDLMAESRRAADVLTFRGFRAAFGIGLVVLGFALQLIGSLPL